MPELQQALTQDFIILIHESTGIDVTKNTSSLTSPEIGAMVIEVKKVYDKIFESRVVNHDMKIFIANSFLCRLYELWKNSAVPELFFIKIRHNFTPAQIVAALEPWVLNFFNAHKNIFPHKQGKIRTIALYYFRMYSGGIERFLSLIIPIYIQMGYRIVLFTDEYKPELEYPLPPPSHNFFRIILKSRGQTLERLTEFEKHFQEYGVDLFIGHQHWATTSPVLQILISKLCGVKVMMMFHIALNYYKFDLTNFSPYKLTDGLINLSKSRQIFWWNFGIRSYFIPLPTYFNNDENFIQNEKIYRGESS